jgi:Holliday junction DNA helicase RuvA
MINYLKGKLTHKTATEVTLEVGGIGFQVKVSLNTYEHIKELEDIRLPVYFHLNVGSNLTSYAFYGFLDEQEKQIFLLLTSVSGVGMNTGMLVLSSLTSTDVIAALQTENVTTFQRIKGIGEKTAKRIILELKDKAKLLDGGILAEQIGSGGFSADNQARNEAIEALVALGFLRPNSQKVVNQLLKADASLKTEGLIRGALKLLS